MKERPILFSAPMVRALLDGTKTQTRRVVKPAMALELTENGGFSYSDKKGKRWMCGVGSNHAESMRNFSTHHCPFGQPGDRLWVRESWRIGAWSEDDGKLAIDYVASAPGKTPWITVPEDSEKYHSNSVFEKYWIQSTDDCIVTGVKPGDDDRYHWEPGQSPCRKRPSIHMPRWASRITLEITGVRVERLQDISEADALAEGVKAGDFEYHENAEGTESAKESYECLWESINGPGSWDLNPWVWVLEFKRVEGGSA